MMSVLEDDDYHYHYYHHAYLSISITLYMNDISDNDTANHTFLCS